MLQTNDGDNLILVRKGLTKFYDIKIEFVNEHRYNAALFENGVFSKNEMNMRDYTLGGVF